jgi:hypothetical protein
VSRVSDRQSIGQFLHRENNSFFATILQPSGKCAKVKKNDAMVLKENAKHSNE